MGNQDDAEKVKKNIFVGFMTSFKIDRSTNSVRLCLCSLHAEHSLFERLHEALLLILRGAAPGRYRERDKRTIKQTALNKKHPFVCCRESIEVVCTPCGTLRWFSRKTKMMWLCICANYAGLSVGKMLVVLAALCCSRMERAQRKVLTDVLFIAHKPDGGTVRSFEPIKMSKGRQTPSQTPSWGVCMT